ncbi:TPA: flagellar type III secretion system protein FliR [Candidatus Latescibacteria bacterium]|nr:flagellar biosynthetic protein FliR [Gemmatimonadota bacterium]HAA74799.1 flagellar type III secretion system protein FliR [Candidatus Latescibacterota bacterium]|tara:strand:+ start:1292 stop:2080 length:789 start_codon:yes stop_codon:yes gene_type:complete
MDLTWLDFSVARWQVFLLVFVRIIGVIAVSPFFGHRVIISQAKIGLGLVVAIMMFSSMPVHIDPEPNLLPYLILAGKELILGMLFGYTARLVFYAVQFAGEIIGIDIGFGVVNIIDPLSAEQISVIGTFKNLIAIVTFLAIDGHHVILNALIKSFEMLPLGGVHLGAGVGQSVIDTTAQVFVMAIQMAAPVITSLFLTSLALGIVARTVPQMNVFIVGFPLKIGVGVAMLMISLPLFQVVLVKLFGDIGPNLSVLMTQMQNP